MENGKLKMENEIIIDGVNVAGCKYYHYKGCTANNLCKCNSRLNVCKNCYYKQLQRLKQENEKLRKANFDYNIACCRLEEYGKHLKQALEEIKEIAEYSIMHNEKLNSNYQIILQKIAEVME